MLLSVVLALGVPPLALGAVAPVHHQRGVSDDTPLFTRRDISIEEASSAGIVQLLQNPKPDHFRSPIHARQRSLDRRAGTGNETVNTLFSGVYPVVNLTWGNTNANTPGQQFISFIDTGSSDSWVISSDLQCVDINTRVPLSQEACGFGPLYDSSTGSFTNISAQKFSISYFPEEESLQGDMGYAPITLGGLTVPKQEVALVNYAAWIGDGSSSGLLGLGYPAITSASNRKTGKSVEYDPLFTTMVKQGVVSTAIFTLAIDRVPQGTSPLAPAGLMAVGGLVPASYYDAPFTSVAIQSSGGEFTWYTINHTLKYGTNGSFTELTTSGTYQSIVDSGTSPNFIPTSHAKALNALFDPPAVYNATLDYYTVDCDATAPYAAYVIGGVEMAMDPQDMIVRSLNGLPGYENVCFSAFADGGAQTAGNVFIIGAVWQRSYVVAYDQARSMMHFANRKPY
ncbi:aspartic peptidase domain-containing protein [Xylariales sp. AK1849]|nr:aspartic peptidase domain-containing protein [Xylariales sp. AK1849]